MASQSATTFELGEGEDDYLLHGSESYVTNHRHLNELHRDHESTAILRWTDEAVGEAAIHKRLLDRDRLKDPTNGVKYFKSFLRPLFVKGAANVFLYRFQRFMNMHRGNGDMLRWITRFQLSVNRMQEAWNDTYIPINGPEQCRGDGKSQQSAQGSAPSLLDFQKKSRQNSRLKRRWKEPTIGSRISMPGRFRLRQTPNLVALIVVSLSDLTQEQRQVLTSLMAHRNRVLADYNTAELHEVYLEIFCTTKTTVDNPLLAPSGHGGRKTFLVIEEGYLDGSEGYWVEDEDDGAEGFLETDEDAFSIYDEENYSWFQRRFQGRRMCRRIFRKALLQKEERQVKSC
eukprot:s6772_g5.t1